MPKVKVIGGLYLVVSEMWARKRGDVPMLGFLERASPLALSQLLSDEPHRLVAAPSDRRRRARNAGYAGFFHSL